MGVVAGGGWPAGHRRSGGASTGGMLGRGCMWGVVGHVPPMANWVQRHHQIVYTTTPSQWGGSARKARQCAVRKVNAEE